MDIYEEPGTRGVLDLAKAKAVLSTSGHVSNEATRRAQVAEITAGALLDIAYSLRVVAAEAEMSMPSMFTDIDTGDDGSGNGGEEVPDFFVESDRVKTRGGAVSGTIVKLGVTEGAVYADVEFDAYEEVPSFVGRVWVENLERVVPTPDESGIDHDVMEASDAGLDGHGAKLPESTVSAEGFGFADRASSGQEPIDPADLVDDDIDSDFEGDEHPAAANALEVLKANERERKAAKKSKGKKP